MKFSAVILAPACFAGGGLGARTAHPEEEVHRFLAGVYGIDGGLARLFKRVLRDQRESWEEVCGEDGRGVEVAPRAASIGLQLISTVPVAYALHLAGCRRIYYPAAAQPSPLNLYGAFGDRGAPSEGAALPPYRLDAYELAVREASQVAEDSVRLFDIPLAEDGGGLRLNSVFFPHRLMQAPPFRRLASVLPEPSELPFRPSSFLLLLAPPAATAPAAAKISAFAAGTAPYAASVGASWLRMALAEVRRAVASGRLGSQDVLVLVDDSLTESEPAATRHGSKAPEPTTAGSNLSQAAAKQDSADEYERAVTETAPPISIEFLSKLVPKDDDRQTDLRDLLRLKLYPRADIIIADEGSDKALIAAAIGGGEVILVQRIDGARPLVRPLPPTFINAHRFRGDPACFTNNFYALVAAIYGTGDIKVCSKEYTISTDCVAAYVRAALAER